MAVKRIFSKKTHMKSMTSHRSNENFALRIQFPVELSIVDKIQNFHDKICCLSGPGQKVWNWPG